MNDIITVRGFVASEIRTSTTPAGTGTASFRLGSTERRFDRANNVWIDGNTNWFTVQAFRQLAGNIGCSVKKGQRIIAVGRLKLRQWEHDGKIYHVAEIVAESVGHDLMWGSANFTRTVSGAGPQSTPAPAVAEAEPEAPWPSAEEEGEAGVRDDDDGGAATEREVILPAGEGDESALIDTETGELVDAVA
ncbi:single-stranded DNA-binding protein [Arthrobacter sp. NA-172]|uniref:single-stranded DNA-binding protein n=1 Tax=Arthrobacter sp. NA-172 TaxID=3367524 RepID=UPI0037542681